MNDWHVDADSLERDAAALRHALETTSPDDEVHVSLSRETAEMVARIVDAHAHGSRVLITRAHAEVSPAEAALLLGMSRPQVRKLLDDGALAFRMVGAHHRITTESVQAFLDRERPRRRAALADLAQLQDELGLVE